MRGVHHTYCVLGVLTGPRLLLPRQPPLPEPGPAPWPLHTPSSLLVCSLARPTSLGPDEPAHLTNLVFPGHTLEPDQVRARLCAQGPRVSAQGNMVGFMGDGTGLFRLPLCLWSLAQCCWMDASTTSLAVPNSPSRGACYPHLQTRN